MPNIAIEGRLFTSLTELNSRLLKQMDARLSTHGISHTEYQILSCLNKAPNGSLSRIDLARSVGMSASGVTRVLAPMEKLGMVEKEKHPRDARKSMVKLSGAGRRIQEESSVAFQDCAEDLFESLTTNQIEQINDLVNRL